ncbi:hypothetical protein COT97_03350 [Candidatus Falkowbacteria bacterium CG10_big_fil_rev_8_21_14_0_10_39_11]|uniref:Uncharacterized protein n=1 Tax=Candidatus Falkowbacteria bacterium CG10_big_fil_rev_8_21_14_0_10_39_11 TaxID=1974565 RepID=A0A2H0V4P0_9BACT|nr:MAG: hypothetical protein COT97_03350 [Candidatus Falkowbacteria bacterium CG10_big_fil_rev_8_21_14_0_10_39_11]
MKANKVVVSLILLLSSILICSCIKQEARWTRCLAEEVDGSELACLLNADRNGLSAEIVKQHGERFFMGEYLRLNFRNQPRRKIMLDIVKANPGIIDEQGVMLDVFETFRSHCECDNENSLAQCEAALEVADYGQLPLNRKYAILDCILAINMKRKNFDRVKELAAKYNVDLPRYFEFQFVVPLKGNTQTLSQEMGRLIESARQILTPNQVNDVFSDIAIQFTTEDRYCSLVAWHEAFGDMANWADVEKQCWTNLALQQYDIFSAAIRTLVRTPNDCLWLGKQFQETCNESCACSCTIKLKELAENSICQSATTSVATVASVRNHFARVCFFKVLLKHNPKEDKDISGMEMCYKLLPKDEEVQKIYSAYAAYYYFKYDNPQLAAAWFRKSGISDELMLKLIEQDDPWKMIITFLYHNK